MPPAPLKIMMNVANPERAFDFAMLPNAGVGLARLEMIIASHIGVHPKALLNYDKQDAETRRKIDERIAGYASPVDFYVDRLAEGIATITAAFAPQPVIVRLSDFKSNEYANLIGGIELRAARRESDDRFPWRQPLCRSDVHRCVRAGMPGHEKGARADGPGQCLGDDSVRAHPRRRPPGRRSAGREWPQARARTASRSS
jgi:phosphoenolpyruvate synthase/pyruvate phosphate dikinase